MKHTSPNPFSPTKTSKSRGRGRGRRKSSASMQQQPPTTCTSGLLFAAAVRRPCTPHTHTHTHTQPDQKYSKTSRPTPFWKTASVCVCFVSLLIVPLLSLCTDSAGGKVPYAVRRGYYGGSRWICIAVAGAGVVYLVVICAIYLYTDSAVLRYTPSATVQS
ncbi:uncharacterized protein BO72DRAFT_244270 [Aspergillus fijiensis CBS 313.89]|uniref:Uncharacterized protein n=1 Tax=Aspergillus fijiensis CBS 313.89 TaxID=1448319 RepID=A0A8G1RHH3_9EURO|nr:uncharacterized protein BO72DRAFT_244270 [Aspergillus fijiensis CBS 313.89]RAK73430.1 hypothetical protein BO72DRAFT_244270 [Aspergillus fijiensis CBS 313.89]